MDRPTCASCRFFEGYASTIGQCRRNAPRLVDPDGHNRIFPNVFPASDWCGEHKPKPAADTSRCNRVLQAQGRSYPRTCAGCLMGPCPVLKDGMEARP